MADTLLIILLFLIAFSGGLSGYYLYPMIHKEDNNDD